MKFLNQLKKFPLLEALDKATSSYLNVRIRTEDRLVLGITNSFKWFKAKITNNRLTYAGYSARTVFPQKIPEKKRTDKTDFENEWLFAATDFTAIVISQIWKSDQIIWEEENARLQYEFLLSRFLFQVSTSIKIANWKVHGEKSKLPQEYMVHPEFPLAEYQEQGFAVSLSKDGFLHRMEQGTGKTPIAINEMCVVGLKMKRMARILILCPKQVRENWASEIEKFSTVPAKVVIVHGDKIRRINAFVDSIRQEVDCEYSACICGYDSVTCTFDEMSLIEWDMIVLDESHYIRNVSTKRTQAILKLREKTPTRRCLTGTPIVNSLMDLWPQLEFMAEGLSGFASFKAFKSFYGVYERSSSGRDQLVGFQNVPLIQERLARVSYHISKKEANLGLPDKTYDKYAVYMTKKQAEVYEQVKSFLSVEMEKLDGSDDQMTINHVLTQMMRLAQITSGFVTTDEKFDPFSMEQKAFRQVKQIESNYQDNPKIKGVLDILSETPNNCKTIIWACFREDLRLLGEATFNAGYNPVSYYGGVSESNRSEAVHRFNFDDATRVFIGNPASCSEGLNLIGTDPNKDDWTTYCGHVIYFSQNWSPVQRSQSEDRSHRRGVKWNVRYTDLYIPNTIDIEMREVVTGKIQVANDVQNLKAMMKRILDAKIEFD